MFAPLGVQGFRSSGFRGSGLFLFLVKGFRA